MNEHYQNRIEQKILPPETVISDGVRYIIQQTVQQGRRSIREGYIRSNCISSPEFIFACELAECTGLEIIT